MEPRRICKGICKRFRVKKPAGLGRYRAGQGHCQTCDMWIDRNGAHLVDGSPAVRDSKGWFCNCCNFRVRRNPRNTEYKAKLRSSGSPAAAKPDSSEKAAIDMTHFNKRRARMLMNLGRAIVAGGRRGAHGAGRPASDSPLTAEVESEFDASFGDILDLACADTPNKASLIAELEAVRDRLGRTPTIQDMTDHSRFEMSCYEAEFGSWEHLLERMGYDPFYRI